MEEKTDKELYKEFLLGNNKSFEEIVIRHKDSIIYFIQRYTKSVDIAEDLAQDVFVYILMHKKNYRFEYSLKTYLYTIAKSKALNYIKREKRIVALDENQYEDLEELEEKVFKFFFSKRNCTPCPVGTKSEKGERSRNSYQLAPFQGWKGGEQ